MVQFSLLTRLSQRQWPSRPILAFMILELITYRIIAKAKDRLN